MPPTAIDPKEIREQIVKTLKLDNLPREQQDEVISMLSDALLQRASVALMARLTDEQLEKADALAALGTDQASAYIKTVVPDMDKVVADEIESGLKEYRDYLAEEERKEPSTQ